MGHCVPVLAGVSTDRSRFFVGLDILAWAQVWHRLHSLTPDSPYLGGLHARLCWQA